MGDGTLTEGTQFGESPQTLMLPQFIWQRLSGGDAWVFDCGSSSLWYTPVLKVLFQGLIQVWADLASIPLLIAKSCRFSLFWGYISQFRHSAPSFCKSWIRLCIWFNNSKDIEATVSILILWKHIFNMYGDILKKSLFKTVWVLTWDQ